MADSRTFDYILFLCWDNPFSADIKTGNEFNILDIQYPKTFSKLEKSTPSIDPYGTCDANKKGLHLASRTKHILLIIWPKLHFMQICSENLITCTSEKYACLCNIIYLIIFTNKLNLLLNYLLYFIYNAKNIEIYRIADSTL